ncbi:tRNA pseudouridine(55) synthase [Candidatus Phytoplasma oryzae]|uniref:tRNA pseudouridine synthase B n=1 Tax=Candidatus Phytoplasma oryzae TaxID=203274 RepID=A0A139JQ68_9MOLU|nr:tRNA pseudouridine(55) synthase TruB [Candidatus Phytoplasma oryzae]KXT29113.1 tRNA pseudouridine(55) synthase [Candidatus Phytoplasma oryzae]RAM57815.1 pseudouridine synthase [Candidatus Phytoplasma oryzae]
MEGFFLIYKKKGISSHDVVQQIKKKFNLTKAGHTGTLDPFAEGLLIVLVNNFTKLSFLFENLDKTYEGIILFHKKYDTLDITGRLIDQKNKNDIYLNSEIIQKIFNDFRKKEYWQVPPLFSAIKIKGQKMYQLARKKIQISIPSRKVNIYDLKMISFLKPDQVKFFVRVSKGTYIRSLARDIAEKLNTYGCLKKLVRISIGPYSLKRSQTLELISRENLININIFFNHCQKIILNEYLVKLVKNGIYLDKRQIITNNPFIVLDKNKKWIAYYEPISPHKYCPKYFF